ncbi:hypothetical protein ACRBEV_10120 [Methylobacterium phyllosphaerae]
MRSEPAASTSNTSPLWAILNDLRDAGIRPTPLNIIARATDLAMPDADISLIVDELATGRGLDEVAA